MIYKVFSLLTCVVSLQSFALLQSVSSLNRSFSIINACKMPLTKKSCQNASTSACVKFSKTIDLVKKECRSITPIQVARVLFSFASNSKVQDIAAFTSFNSMIRHEILSINKRHDWTVTELFDLERQKKIPTKVRDDYINILSTDSVNLNTALKTGIMFGGLAPLVLGTKNLYPITETIFVPLGLCILPLAKWNGDVKQISHIIKKHPQKTIPLTNQLYWFFMK